MAKRILVVEQHDGDRELLKLIFSTHGFDVDTTTNAGEAIEMMKSRRPDLLVVDTDLPDTNGWDFCEQVKHQTMEAGIPLVMLSARLPQQSRIDGSCADDFLVKPFNDEKLLTKIRHLLAA